VEGLLGSIASEPIAPESIPVDACQVGVAANGLSLHQTPPPAAPATRRQPAGVHDAEAASAVMRPEFVVTRPASVTVAGTVGVNGPSSCHDEAAVVAASMRSNALSAPCCCENEIVSAGSARFSYCSSASV
jgi:hypothetical protein